MCKERDRNLNLWLPDPRALSPWPWVPCGETPPGNVFGRVVLWGSTSSARADTRMREPWHPPRLPQLLIRALGQRYKSQAWPSTQLPQRDPGCNCWGCSCQWKERQMGTGRRSQWPIPAPDPAFLRHREDTTWALPTAPVFKALWIQSCHISVSTPQNFQLTILGEALRSLFLGQPGLLRGNRPTQPKCTCPGTSVFLLWLPEQRKQQWLQKPPLHHSPGWPLPMEARLCILVSSLFSHPRKTICSETKNLPNPPLSWNCFQSLICWALPGMPRFLWTPALQGEGGKPLDPGLEQHVHLGERALEAPPQNYCTGYFTPNSSKVGGFLRSGPSSWPQGSYSKTGGSG